MYKTKPEEEKHVQQQNQRGGKWQKIAAPRCFCTAFAQQPCLTEESTTAAYYGGKAYVKKKKI